MHLSVLNFCLCVPTRDPVGDHRPFAPKLVLQSVQAVFLFPTPLLLPDLLITTFLQSNILKCLPLLPQFPRPTSLLWLLSLHFCPCTPSTNLLVLRQPLKSVPSLQSQCGLPTHFCYRINKILSLAALRPTYQSLLQITSFPKFHIYKLQKMSIIVFSGFLLDVVWEDCKQKLTCLYYLIALGSMAQNIYLYKHNKIENREEQIGSIKKISIIIQKSILYILIKNKQIQMCMRMIDIYINIVYIFEAKMQQSQECIGCRKQFQQNQKLMVSHAVHQLKNYGIPMKEHQQRWNLLKTIVSFLNCKGGTIFIGIDQNSSEAKGIFIQRKQQDDFMLFVQQLTSRIEPQVDLSDREQIVVQFVPVVHKGEHTGRYVVKIVVQQGDPTQTYCFLQRLQLQLHMDKKSIDEYQVLYSFKKNNFGLDVEYKGFELIQQTRRKALNPSAKSNTFHEHCNPTPTLFAAKAKLLNKIGFTNVFVPETCAKLTEWFKDYLLELKISEKQSSIKWDKKSQTIIIEINNEEMYEKVLKLIEGHIEKLNRSLPDCRFAKIQNPVNGVQIFQNTLGVQKQQKIIATPKKDIKISKNQQQQPPKKQQIISSPNSNPKNTHQPKQKFNKNLCFTFTHISPKLREEFCRKLDELLECPKEFRPYVNSVEVLFKDKEQFESYTMIANMEAQELQKYGFNGELVMGINTAVIEIRNYNNHKIKQMKLYIEGIVDRDLKSCNFKKKANKFTLMVELRSSGKACEWLDKFLTDRNMRQFQIPGAGTGQNPKMKYHLLCRNLEEEMYI